MSNPYSTPATSHNVEATSPSHKVPRLGISHLLIWMTLTAVMFSISQAGVSDYGEVSKIVEYSWAMSAIVGAISVTAFWILYQSRESLATMMRLPGHWMIFCNATLTIVLALFSLAMFLFPDTFYDAPNWATSNAYAYRFWQSLYPFSIGAVSTAAFGYASWKNAGIWRLLFGLGAFFCLADTLVPIGISFVPSTTGGVRIATGTLASFATTLLSAVMMMVACFMKPEGEHRDWLHWLGVFVVGFGSMMGIVAFMI